MDLGVGDRGGCREHEPGDGDGMGRVSDESMNRVNGEGMSWIDD